ncbi:MAG: glycosyltransferase family 2 protein [Defluviimonas sp.]|uniref:glycosyltransferase family 2 protein n=1 Tax=Albidovulum sp. TaxID=1872424 RepID=UPI002A2A9680|nr:glycosyltransferase family 2 protein [Defluviimonas sp.]
MSNTDQDLSSWSSDDSLTVIVVSYNTRELTLAALRTLFAETRNPYLHVVVYDNDSRDGSADAVAAAFPQVELIRSTTNEGFAKANNIVAARARSNWLLLLNPDTEVQDGAVDKLLAFARSRPAGGIYGGRTVFPDGTLNMASCWKKITPWSVFCAASGLITLFPGSSLFNPEAMAGWPRDTVREVDIVVGCFLMIRRELWDRLGGFDARYFMYGEEADLCLRAARLGYRPVITPGAQIMHLVGASASVRSDRIKSLAKARVSLIRDHWPRAWVPFGIAMMWIWAAIRSSGFRLKGAWKGGEARDKAEAWAAAWHDRRDWLKGY